MTAFASRRPSMSRSSLWIRHRAGTPNLTAAWPRNSSSIRMDCSGLEPFPLRSNVMKASVFVLLGLSLTPWVAFAQVIPAPVPESEVFTRAEIGHALAPPTPNAGKAAPDAANAPPDDGQWSMPSKNYAATRYSSLTEITTENVKQLEPVITFSLAVNKGQEAAPIV